MPKLALLVLIASLSGCTADAIDDDGDSSEGDVIAGSETFEQPAIGMLRNGGSYCTATLIRPNVVLTAAHCVTNSPKDEPVTGYSFEVRPAAGVAATRFEIDRAYAVPTAADFDGTQAWRAKDIALLRLARAVPSSLAAPLTVARVRPPRGSAVTIYGYGCTDRTPGPNGQRPGGGVKRRAAVAWNGSATRNVCPGDSGGPWLDVARGAVFGTTSGYVNLDDRYGDVPASAALINRVADGWR